MESINQFVEYRKNHLPHHEYREVVFVGYHSYSWWTEFNSIIRKQNHIEEIYLPSNSWPRIKGLYWVERHMNPLPCWDLFYISYSTFLYPIICVLFLFLLIFIFLLIFLFYLFNFFFLLEIIFHSLFDLLIWQSTILFRLVQMLGRQMTKNFHLHILRNIGMLLWIPSGRALCSS